MKKFFLVLIMIFFHHHSFAQEFFTDEFKYKAIYELTYQQDSTDVNSVRSEEMVLYIGDRISRFSSRGTAIRDSLMANRDRSDKSMAAFDRLQSQIPETKLKYYIYKGLPAEQFSFTNSFGKDHFLYVADLDIIDWQMHTETKGIAGYQAQKATGSFAGRNYTAWFTSEIPIPDGPYKFNGLPGLIVEIADQKEHYSFLLTGFEVLRESVPFEFVAKDYFSVEKRKFLDILQENERNPLTVLERQGMSFAFPPGQRERMHREHLEQLKKRNNPIELE